MENTGLKKFNKNSFNWMEEAEQRFSGCPLPVNKGMFAVWETQTPPTFPPALETDEDAERLYCWWLLSGGTHHSFVPFRFEESLLPHLSRTVFTAAGEPLPLWMLRYWEADRTLWEKFPLDKNGAAAGLAIYLLGKLRKQGKYLQLGQLPEEVTAYLNAPVESAPLPIPLFLKTLCVENVEGARKFKLTDKVGCAALLLWFIRFDGKILPGFSPRYSPRLAPLLAENAPDADMALALEAASKVFKKSTEKFPLGTQEGRLDFACWLATKPYAGHASLKLFQKLWEALIAPHFKPAIPVPPVLLALWQLNLNGAKETFDLSTAAGCAGLLLWYWQYKGKSLPDFQITFGEDLADALCALDEASGMPLALAGAKILNPKSEGKFALDEKKGQLDFACWLLLKPFAGQTDDPFLQKLWQNLIAAHFKPALPVPIPLLALWQANRNGAKETFDISTAAGCAGLLLWYWQYKGKSLPDFKISFGENLADALCALDAASGMPLALAGAKILNPKSEGKFALLEKEGQLDFACWLLLKPFAGHTDDPFLQKLWQNLIAAHFKPALPLPLPLLALWEANRNGAKETFDISTAAGCAGLLLWYWQYKGKSLPDFKISFGEDLADALCALDAASGMPLALAGAKIIFPKSEGKFALLEKEGQLDFACWLLLKPFAGQTDDPFLEKLWQNLIEAHFRTAIPLPAPLLALWQANSNGARETFDLSTDAGCAGALLWYLRYRGESLPDFNISLDPALAERICQGEAPAALAGAGLVFPKSGAEFLSGGEEKHLDFACWLVIRPYAAQGGDPFLEKVWDTLISSRIPSALPLPPLLLALWHENLNGAKKYDIATISGCAALLLWFIAYRESIVPSARLSFDTRLAARFLGPDEQGMQVLASGLRVAWPEAVPYFPVETQEERNNYYKWAYAERLGRDNPEPLLKLLREGLFPAESGKRKKAPKKPVPAEPERASTPLPLLAGGMNIVGFVKGELGLGEDSRMAAASCMAAEVPFAVMDAPIAISSRKQAEFAGPAISEIPVYDVNLICLPGIETLRMFFKTGPEFFIGKYNIGMWQWELPRWPRRLERALPLAQEYWASSRFVQEMMEGAAKNVVYMPLPVQLPQFDTASRQEHGLPEDAFLFLYVFDGLSWGARKNPFAVIRAFQDAFPARRDARLVIKTMNATDKMPFWKGVLEAAARDDRIICINEVSSRGRLLSLMNNCDAYVSLHRSEGFGRTIAEAMLLRKPVIATAWSGNADFTTDETAYAISGKMIPLEKDDYLFWENQFWCDPSHDQAVEAMIAVQRGAPGTGEKVRKAYDLIESVYSPGNVGRLYRERLTRIGVL